MPVYIVANPNSGRGRGVTVGQRIHLCLTQAGYDARILSGAISPLTTAAPWPASAALPRVPEGEIDAVIIIGGDGTLRSIATRFYLQTGRIPPILLVPFGTANLMGQHLGIHWHEADVDRDVAAALAARRLRHVDVAMANNELMLLVAGVGIDGKVIHELNRVRSGPITLASYLMPAATALGFYNYPPLTVFADGRRIFAPRPAMAFVANVKEYGTGFPLLPQARSDDGRLDVCVVPCSSRAELLAALLHAAADELTQCEGVVSVRARQVRIESTAAVPLQVDGEAAGTTPVEIRLLPIRLPLILPAEK